MSQQIIIDYWLDKAWEDLVSDRDNLKLGTYAIYYFDYNYEHGEHPR